MPYETTAPVDGQTFTLTTGADTIPGLEGSAGSTGTDGDDTIKGKVDDDGTTNNTTLSALDDIDGGLGDDTLEVSVLDETGGSTQDQLNAITLANVENVQFASAVGLTVDVSAFADVTAVSLTNGKDTDITASSTADVDISGASGAIDVDGGKDVSVTHATADEDITIGDTTVNDGTITVTDTAQGKGEIAIDGGTDVTVDATSEADSTSGAEGRITVGDTGNTSVGTIGTASDGSTGAINITQNLEHDGDGGIAGGDISVTGGSTVDITVNANNVAEADDSDDDITVGTVDVTGYDDTTSVNVVQNDNSEQFTSDVVAGTAAQVVVTFSDLDDGDTVTVDSLTFEASDNLEAEEVAQAFANLENGDTQEDGGPG